LCVGAFDYTMTESQNASYWNSFTAERFVVGDAPLAYARGLSRRGFLRSRMLARRPNINTERTDEE
jgi:hypothetical protein